MVGCGGGGGGFRHETTGTGRRGDKMQCCAVVFRGLGGDVFLARLVTNADESVRAACFPAGMQNEKQRSVLS